MSYALLSLEELLEQHKKDKAAVEGAVISEFVGSLLERCKGIEHNKYDAIQLMNFTFDHYFNNVHKHKFKGGILEQLK